ncbi:OmpA family protein [Empedobacter falsenii]|uniref:OmpA family protein n=1 Tax=Empedobacter falsenii TaxID=343874 RepID=UPI002575F249|nr:OmpA family protein [Empedobacter falsenii]MDM1546580.1 OmpA family protein [Empedobacter falsenii]
MKKLLSLLILGAAACASAQTKYDEKPFNNSKKEFNDWSLSVFAGANAMQNSDLVSFMGGGYFTPGYDFQFQVNKQISHAFGLSLQYQLGQTRQKGTIYDNTPWGNAYQGKAHGKTKYNGISVLADINASNLLRRVDNKTEFKWAMHLYGGFGILGYKAYRQHYYGSGNDYGLVTDQKLSDKSVYAQVGAGLRYKLSDKLDLELRGMYVMSGDEEFDGSGKPVIGYWTAADVEEGRDDNMITLSLGLHYKIGKHKDALQWVSPIAYKAPVEQTPFECIDEDRDGVCDQWDKCLGTPEGIRVDGSGCSLDSDGDGIPDSEDKCPTIPGPPTNGGCPEKVIRISGEDVATTINAYLEGIEFDYNSDRIREQSYEKLNHASEVLLANPDFKFVVEGHTDAAGGVDYNQKLSERRAASVVRYLANKGVDTTKLSSVGKGKSDLKWPECNPVTNCPAWKNLENRRVIFKEIK